MSWSSWLGCAALLLAACGERGAPAPAVTGAPASPAPIATAPAPSDGSPATATAGEVIPLETNTQVTVGDVRIGAGNFRDAEYTDPSGARRSGRTAALWIFVRGDSGQDHKLRAYPGLSFTASNRRFDVVDVTETIVRLRLSPP